MQHVSIHSAIYQHMLQCICMLYSSKIDDTFFKNLIQNIYMVFTTKKEPINSIDNLHFVK